jgi:GalNAc-alpha-(1->4)-GalNAc-alpha-(1->3)-diNAcBac-PP-undecaprenol alpha-1,4-N-acetyl-D-galactosaminyltransferase
LSILYFNCPSGPSDLISHNNNGLLVNPNDIVAMAEAMQFLIDNPEIRKKFSNQANDIIQRFNEVKIMMLWDEAVWS